MVPHVSAEQNVYKWAKLFKEGRKSVEDEDRPGRPTEVRSPEVIKSVNDLIQSNRKVTVDDIARTLSFYVGKALLPHLPYSPDLAPSDFHLFGLLKSINQSINQFYFIFVQISIHRNK